MTRKDRKRHQRRKHRPRESRRDKVKVSLMSTPYGGKQVPL